MINDAQAIPPHVSTGEPDDKWKQAVTWFKPMLLLFPFGWGLQFLEAYFNDNVGLVIGFFVVSMIVLCNVIVRIRLAKQRVDLLIDRRPVRIDLHTDTSRRTWLAWKSGQRGDKACIGDRYVTGWVDHEIALGGKQYRLRILIKPYGDGCMLSNVDRGFHMKVLGNTFCI